MKPHPAAVTELFASIDYLDPCTRTRQVTALSRLEARFFGRRVQRLYIRFVAASVAMTLLVAYVH